MLQKTIYRRSHGGDIYRNKVQYDFSINLNPLGMPDGVQEALKNSIPQWSCYPDPDCEKLRQLLSAKHSCSPEEIICGNGAAELLYQIVRIVHPKKAVVPIPAFSEYAHALHYVGTRVVSVCGNVDQDMNADGEKLLSAIQDDVQMVLICNPNNPNGLLYPDELVTQVCEICQKKGIWLLIDECFLELSSEQEKWYGGHAWDDHVIRLRAFTKTYAMAGLRLGYALTRNQDILEQIRHSCQPWSVSVPAQIAGIAALKEEEYLMRSREMIRKERRWMTEQLNALGIKVYPSDSNFLLFYVQKEDLMEQLLKEGILIRDCSNYEGLGTGYYRVCVRKREENEFFLNQLILHMN